LPLVKRGAVYLSVGFPVELHAVEADAGRRGRLTRSLARLKEPVLKLALVVGDTLPAEDHAIGKLQPRRQDERLAVLEREERREEVDQVLGGVCVEVERKLGRALAVQVVEVPVARLPYRKASRGDAGTDVQRIPRSGISRRQWGALCGARAFGNGWTHPPTFRNWNFSTLLFSFGADTFTRDRAAGVNPNSTNH
jgi:hypothetical protein